MRNLRKKLDKWGYKTDPEGLTNYDGVTMALILFVGLGSCAIGFIFLNICCI